MYSRLWCAAASSVLFTSLVCSHKIHILGRVLQTPLEILQGCSPQKINFVNRRSNCNFKALWHSRPCCLWHWQLGWREGRGRRGGTGGTGHCIKHAADIWAVPMRMYTLSSPTLEQSIIISDLWPSQLLLLEPKGTLEGGPGVCRPRLPAAAAWREGPKCVRHLGWSFLW